MSAPDLYTLYLDAYIGVDSGVRWARNHEAEEVAVALATHAKRCPLPPLSRPALLAEVARLCGEEQANPDEVGEALIRADERARVLDELDSWGAARQWNDSGDANAVAAFVTEQRKVVRP